MRGTVCKCGMLGKKQQEETRRALKTWFVVKLPDKALLGLWVHQLCLFLQAIISCPLEKKNKVFLKNVAKGQRKLDAGSFIYLSFAVQLLEEFVDLRNHHQWNDSSVSSSGTAPQPLRTLWSCSHPALPASRNLNYLLGKQTLLFELHKVLFLSVPSMELLKTPGHCSAFIQNSGIRAHI